MKRLVSHDTWASIIGMLYLGLIVNLLLLVSCLPFVVLLVTTDPMLSWPLLAIAAPLCAPGIAAAFRAFREHTDGGLGPIRAFRAGLRDTWRRALVVGAVVIAVVVVVLVDVRMLSGTSAAVVVVPLLGVLTVLAVAIGLLALVAIAEAPTRPAARRAAGERRARPPALVPDRRVARRARGAGRGVRRRARDRARRHGIRDPLLRVDQLALHAASRARSRRGRRRVAQARPP